MEISLSPCTYAEFMGAYNCPLISHVDGWFPAHHWVYQQVYQISRLAANAGHVVILDHNLGEDYLNLQVWKMH